MENLFFTVLGVILGWIPPAFLWGRDNFTSTKASGITSVVRPHDRPADAKFKCKILVDITNQITPEQPVRLAAAYFVFNKNSSLKPDQKWPREYKTGRFHLYFFSPPTKMHDWRDVYLRSGQTTNTWIALDPQHSDDHIRQAALAENIGRLYFRMTGWTDSGRSKTRWFYRKL